MRDLRYAWRSLARTPVFSATAILILTLSVGATTAVFTLLYALVLRPLPIHDADELARIVTVRRDSEADLTWRMYREFVAHQRMFSAVMPSLDQAAFTLETDRGITRGAVAGAAGNLFEEFRATAALGRLLQPADVDMSVPTGSPVAVLGWTFWQNHYGGDPTVVGRTIKLDGVPLTIVGVAPRGFLGFTVSLEHDLIIPVGLLPSIMSSEPTMVHGTSRWVGTMGRLAPGITLESAQTQLDAMWPAILEAAAPAQFLTTQRDDYFQTRARVDSGATGIERTLRARYTSALYVLLGITGLVVLVAAANLCALVFARAEARRHEFAVRVALGSARLRVIRETAAEGLLVGVTGAAGGLLFASAASQAIIDYLMRDYVVRTSLDTSPDAVIIGIAALTSVAIAVAVSVAAAVGATRHNGLTGSTRTVARSSREGRFLVGAQVAVSIVMLAHASLLVRSVYAVTSVDSGLTSDNVITGSLSQRVDAYRRLDPAEHYPRALERLHAVPGVVAAAFSTFKPEGGGVPTEPIGLAGTATDAGDLRVEWPQVSPGFFATMGVGIRSGRDFSFADTAQTARVVIISASLEQRLFGAGNGLGRHIRLTLRPEWQDAEVIGVVNDARMFDVRGNNRAIAYTSAVQSGAVANYKWLVARAPESAARDLQAAIDAMGIEFLPRTQTLAYARGRSLLRERLMAALSGYFAALALVLVSAGIYGLLSYVLSLRRKEIGIRMALGADAGRMARSILGDGIAVTGIGVLVGLAGAVATVPLLRSVLVSTDPYDPLAIGAGCLSLIAVAVLASLVPALRAGRVEPLSELRGD
jgi:predicted permease